MVDSTNTVPVPLDQIETLLAQNSEALQGSFTNGAALNESQLALSHLVDANAHGQMFESLRGHGIESLELPTNVAEGAVGIESVYAATMFAGDAVMEQNGILRPDVGAGLNETDLGMGGRTSDDGILFAGGGGLRGRTVPGGPTESPNGWDQEGDYEVHLLSNIAGGGWGAVLGQQQHAFVVVTDAGAEPTPENAYLVMRGGPYPIDSPGFNDASREGELYVDDLTTSRFDLAARNITDHGSVPKTDSLANIAARMNRVRNDINPEGDEQAIPYSGGSLASAFNIGANSNTIARLVFQEAIEYQGGDIPAIEPKGVLQGWNINLALPNSIHDHDYEGRYSSVDDNEIIASKNFDAEEFKEDANPDTYRHEEEDYDYGIA